MKNKTDMEEVVESVINGGDLSTINRVSNKLEYIGGYENLVEKLEERVGEELKQMKAEVEKSYIEKEEEKELRRG